MGVSLQRFLGSFSEADFPKNTRFGGSKCCNHDTIAISPIFKMAAAAILDFEKKAIVGAWHHPDLISRGSEDSKTVLTSNTCFFKGVKVKIATIPPDYMLSPGALFAE